MKRTYYIMGNYSAWGPVPYVWIARQRFEMFYRCLVTEPLIIDATDLTCTKS